MSKYINTQLLNGDNIFFSKELDCIFDEHKQGTLQYFIVRYLNGSSKIYPFSTNMTFADAWNNISEIHNAFELGQYNYGTSDRTYVLNTAPDSKIENGKIYIEVEEEL